VRSPILSITRDEVIASLRSTGSSDPEVLAAAMEEMTATVAPLRRMAVVWLLLGFLALATRPGIFVAAPLVGAGVWSGLRALRYRRTIEQGYAEYVRRRVTTDRRAAGDIERVRQG
jgi:hypothetical protein